MKAKIIFGLLFLFTGATFNLNAQNDFKQVAKNANKQQMEVKYGNFTSFKAVHENIAGWEKYNNEKFSKHPEFGKLPYNAEYPNCVEAIEKRKIDERYFINEKNPSEFYIQKAMGALHYNVNGNWVTIDTRITDIGNGIYEATNQWDAVGFDVKKAASYIKTPEGTVYFNNWKLYGTDKEGKEEVLAAANWSSYTAGEDGIYVNNIFPGIDAQMQVFRGSVKTNFIIKKLNYTNYTTLLFKDEFDAGKSSKLNFSGEDENLKRAAKAVSLMSNNKELLQIDQAVAYPQNGTREQKISTDYFLEGNNLVIAVAVNWIQQYIDKTNVIIDPMVSSSNTLAQASITGSMYNASCNFINACTYNLSVTPPAFATITDVQWTFTYKASASQFCELLDGGITFNVGACTSPSGAGFFWYCNAPNPGTCAGTNVSMWTDVSTCMPAPSCAPVPLAFKMNFFRDCLGSAGCSSTCIGANSPWTITIIGQTVNFTNVATPFTVSASTICFGQTISASTSSQYGVPAYTYNWSFNSSGIPSVGSGTNPTISFPSAGTYTLYCIVTDACSQVVSSNQVITVNPIPSVSITPSANPICNGQNTILTASGASTYTWSANAGSVTTNTASVSPGVGSTTYTVTGTSSGCTNTSTVSITTNALPTVTSVASPTAICSGQSAVLTGGGANTYTWSANAGSATTQTVSVSPTVNTTYTVTGTDGNGCVNTSQVSVGITPSPTLATSANPATICVGQSTVLSVNGATTYTWDPNAGSATTNTVSVSPVVNTTYTVTGANGSCTSTQTVSVVVNPLPTLTVTANPVSVCAGQSTTLTGNGATTYTWSANAGSATTNTVSITPGATDTYTLSGTQNGCTNTSTLSVTVNTLPNVTSVASPTAICSGQSAVLTAGGATTYTWDPNAGSATTQTVSVSPTINTTYTVTGTDANGCVNTSQVSVGITPSPTLITNANPATICAGQSTIISVSGATTYTWDANAGSATTSTVSVNPSGNITYTVTGDNGGGCISTQTVTVMVNPLPTLTVTANPASICTGQSTTLTGNGATTYTWSANAGGVTTNTTTITPPATDTYTLSATLNGCSDSTTITVNVGSQTTLTVIATNTTICSGQSTTLTASGATTYTWSTLATTPSVTVSPNVTTTYTVAGSNGGCLGSQTVTLNVNPTPTVTANAAPNAICSGQTATLTASGATTFTWSANAGSATTNTVSVSPNVTDTYTVTGDSLGCTSTQVVTLNVTATPTLNVSSSVIGNLCTGQTATLTASGATTYTWSTLATTSSISVSPTSQTTYTVVGENGNCATMQTITVNTSPTPTISISASASAICAGQTTTLTASGATTYTWDANAGGATTNTVSVSPNTTITYTVTGDSLGCTSTQIIPVTVNQPPTITAVSSQTACAGTNVNAINFVVNPNTASFGWTNTNANVGIAASGTVNIAGYTAPNVATQQTGVITVTPVDLSTSCVGTSQTFTVVINPAPTINGPATTDSSLCGLPDGDVKGLTASGGTPGYTYQWYNGGVAIPGANAANLTNVNIGSYSLVVTDANQCVASSGPYSVLGSLPTTASFTPTPTTGTAPLNVSFTNGSSPNATAYNWNFGNGSTSSSQSPSTIYPTGGTYTITLIASNNGTCASTYTATITVEQTITVVVPNIFSPNGDGINEEFMIISSGVTSLNCDIFNRWGQKIFTISSPTQGWDGTFSNGDKASEGTYFYILTASSYDGKSHNSQGNITLVR